MPVTSPISKLFDKTSMRSKHAPNHISSLLGEMIQNRHWQDRFELHEVFNFWEKAVGKDIAKHATPAKFRGKVLWIEVSDSIWMQQLQFLKITLLTKVNKEFDSVAVEDIRFQLKLPSREAAEVARPPSRRPGAAPTVEDAQRFEQNLEEIEDSDLKQAMLRCWRTLFPYQGQR